MSKLTNSKEISIENLYDLHSTGRIYHDISFNRIKAGAWDDKNKKDYINSIYDTRIFSLIVLVDVESCLAFNKLIGDEAGIEYFEKCKKNGYIYVILDGSNRLGCINDYIAGEFNIIQNKVIYDQTRINLKSKHLLVSFVTSSTKTQLHDDVIRLNSGASWNQQERRNAMDVAIANFVRNVSIGNYKKYVGGKVKSINVKRMQDQELIANCVSLVHSGVFTSSIGLTTLYNLPESVIKTETYKLVETYLNILFDMIGKKGSMKFSKAFFLYMFALIKELDMEGYSIKPNKSKQFFDDLADKWAELDNDEKTLYLALDRGQSYTWKNLMGFIPLEYNQKISVLLSFVYDSLMECIEPKKISSKRSINTATDSKVRYDIAKRDECRVRINGKIGNEWFDPARISEEYQTFKLHEILKSSDIHVDHILALKGPSAGEDDITNMELTTAAYNNWKRAKV